MTKRKKSESISQSEEAEETVRNGRSTISEYEEQRLRRIAENQARLKAMGLPQMVSSLKTLPQIKKKKGKEKEKVEDDDEEYRPENEEERETESDSSSEHDSEFENAFGSRKMKVMSIKATGIAIKLTLEGANQVFYFQTWIFTMVAITCIIVQLNYLNMALDNFNTAVVSPIYYALFTAFTILASAIMFKAKNKSLKNKSLKVKSRVTGKKHGDNLDYVGDEDEALMQAIALSLQNSAEPLVCSNKNVGNLSKPEKKENIHIQEDKERKKNKNSFNSRLQMTEDELIVHFFQLDEAGKGTVAVRDLERAAITHDFTWTDNELVDMIR